MSHPAFVIQPARSSDAAGDNAGQVERPKYGVLWRDIPTQGQEESGTWRQLLQCGSCTVSALALGLTLPPSDMYGQVPKRHQGQNQGTISVSRLRAFVSLLGHRLSSSPLFSFLILHFFSLSIFYLSNFPILPFPFSVSPRSWNRFSPAPAIHSSR